MPVKNPPKTLKPLSTAQREVLGRLFDRIGVITELTTELVTDPFTSEEKHARLETLEEELCRMVDDVALACHEYHISKQRLLTMRDLLPQPVRCRFPDLAKG